jgi:sugar phosphate isomerase/epimerase
MHREFFVHIPYDSFREDHARLLRLGACPEIYLDASVLPRLRGGELEESRRRVERFPALTIHAPFMDISPGASDPDVRALSFSKLRKVIAIADLWGAKLVVVHFKYDPLYYHDHIDRWLDAAAEFFRRLLEKSRQTMIALENVAEPTPYVPIRLAERINHDRIIHCFDFGHHHVFGKIPFDEWIFYLRPRRHIHFHLHDNFGDQDDHLAPGDGSIDWQQAASAIARLPADCSVTLEPHRRPDVVRSVRFYRKFFLQTK